MNKKTIGEPHLSQQEATAAAATTNTIATLTAHHYHDVIMIARLPLEMAVKQLTLEQNNDFSV